ncbi:potassium transporter Kup [Chloroflexia bacterium SDU3-3]|nr:potassium transporter Kup [Chloroflexia bacterium SDU3-3]
MSETPNDGAEQLSATTAPSAPQIDASAESDPAETAHSARHAAQPLGLMALAALGVVYGDIGTSPLYALRECFSGHHAIAATPENVLGVLSLIFWALIIVVTIKYIVFILRADNHGEGGIMALMALATPIRRFHPSKKRWVVLLGVFGAALLYGDGIITPAVSVLSAVEGVKVVTPQLDPYIIPITLVILVGLFVLQSSGTDKIGKLFGPVMLVWFGVLGVLGLVNLLRYPEVLAAINPIHAIIFFAANGWHGFLILGTVFLAVTGGEALYADMGHFGPKPIRMAWFSLVLPTLLLNYFGQGALLLHNPEAVENSFFRLAPTWATIPLVVLSTMATIIASQALISGAFSITMQAENLGFLPRVKIIHTSASAFGQIYIPVVNWMLMVACLAVVLGFRTSSNLAAAYGIAVTSTMAITTLIFAVVARDRWQWPTRRVVPLIAFFLIIDLAFLIANLVKIPQGGWFPLVVAAFIFIVMTTWKRGSRLVYARERDFEQRLDQLLEWLGCNKVARVPGSAIFLSADPKGAPAALLANLKYNRVVHDHILLVSVKIAEVPHIAPEQRMEIEPLGQGLERITLNFGFMEESHVPKALLPLQELRPELAIDQAPYFVNRTKVIASEIPGMALWREQLYTIMRHNATNAVDFFRLPASRVFEIGTSVEF